MTTKQIVMLIDDDKFLLDMYSVKFAAAGFTVSSHFSAAEALKALRDGLRPAVILFDITMPGIDGFAFLETVRSEKLAPESILMPLTNQASEEDKKHAQELGAHQYIVKATMIPSEVVNIVTESLKTAPVQK